MIHLFEEEIKDTIEKINSVKEKSVAMHFFF